VTSVLAAIVLVVLRDREEYGLFAIVLLVAGVQAYVVASLVNGVLLVVGRFRFISALTMLRPGVFLLFLVLWGAVRPISLEATLLLWVIAQLIVNGGAVATIYLSHLHTRLIAWPDWGLLRRMLVFGLTGQGGNLAQILTYRLDSYVILAFVGRAGVGYYSIATAVAEALWYLPTAVSTVLLSRLTQDRAADSPRFTAMASRLTLLVSLVGAAALALVSPFAFPLVFGAEYVRAVPALYGLLPGVLAGAAAKVVANYIFSVGRVRINATVSFIGLAVTLALDLALIPSFGILGAAIASSVSYFVAASLTLVFFQRLSGHSALSALIIQRGDAAEVMDQARRFPLIAPILRRLA
jgi:O-antigen/teichoic acid export membrane protein